MKFFWTFALTFFWILSLQADPVGYVTVAVLDKVTTKVQVFYMHVGESINIRNRIKVRIPACDAPAESSFCQDHKKCFVEIMDCGQGQGCDKRIFSQWMFRDYPVLGSLQHSRYDVWILDCSASESQESKDSRAILGAQEEA